MILIHPQQNYEPDSLKSLKVYVSDFTTHDEYLVSKETYTGVNKFLQATNLHCSLSYSDNSYSLKKTKNQNALSWTALFFSRT